MSIALYYPWMHFQSDAWVKLALLTWDNVARVRAIALPPRDSDLVRQVQAESDLITDLTPTPRDLNAVSLTFTEVIQEHRAEIIARHRWDRPHSGESPYLMADSNTGGTYAPYAPPSFWVYSGDIPGQGTKISSDLRFLLLNHRLAVEPTGEEPWLGMNPELGSIYLAVLADAMARHNVLSPVTDDPHVHRALGSMDQLTALLLGKATPPPALADTHDAYLHVALRTVIEPKQLADIPVAKIIEFRRRHNAGLAAFRTHIASLGEELAQVAAVENLNIAHKHLEAIYRQQTEPLLTELRRALRGLGVESTVGPLGLRIDLNAATGTVLGGVAAAGGQLALAGAAVAVTVVPYVASQLRARHDRKADSPVAYLLAADRKLAGSRLLRTLRP